MIDDETTGSGAAHALDGSAAAGPLAAAFGVEMTAVPTRCTHCGGVHMIGELRAYTRAPGIILRCPACDGIILRIVETTEATYVDARGAAYLRFERG
jgi:Zn finger protein HypA/HybF involved in hydrogenase expression